MSKEIKKTSAPEKAPKVNNGNNTPPVELTKYPDPDSPLNCEEQRRIFEKKMRAIWRKPRLSTERRYALLEEMMKPSSESTIDVFDFEKHWRLVLPFLHSQEVEAALAKVGFDLEAGPWCEFDSDYWMMQISERAHAAVARGEIKFKCRDWGAMTEAQEKEWEQIERQFWPKPDTFEWYQCPGASDELAPFLQELGKRVFPRFAWRRMTGPEYTLVYGADGEGSIKMIFDILNFKDHSALELLQLATQKYPTPRIRGDDLARAEEQLLKRERAEATQQRAGNKGGKGVAAAS